MKFILQCTKWYPELDPSYLEALDRENIKYEIFKSGYQSYRKVGNDWVWVDQQGCIIELNSLEELIKLSNICYFIFNTDTNETLYKDYLNLPVIEFYDDYKE